MNWRESLNKIWSVCGVGEWQWTGTKCVGDYFENFSKIFIHSEQNTTRYKNINRLGTKFIRTKARKRIITPKFFDCGRKNASNSHSARQFLTTKTKAVFKTYKNTKERLSLFQILEWFSVIGNRWQIPFVSKEFKWILNSQTFEFK